MKIQWKSIPIQCLKHLEISEYGDIRQLNNKEIYSQYTYGNGYKYIVILHDEKDKYFAIHRLVALTYIPLPEEGKFKKNLSFSTDGAPYIVNHIDGIKTNNHYTNLEWCDLKHNSQHAIRNSLNPATYKVRVHDVISGEVKVYGSKQAVARELGISNNVDIIIHQFQDKPYRERYLFKIVQLDSRVINRIVNDDKAIYCLDYVNRSCVIYSTAIEAEQQTGIIANTIKARCKSPLSDETKPMGGYDFFYLKDIDTRNPPCLRAFTVEEAQKMRDRYRYNIEHGVTSYMRPVMCIDQITGEVTHHTSLKNLSIALGLSYFRFKNIINRDSKQGLAEHMIDHYRFKYI